MHWVGSAFMLYFMLSVQSRRDTVHRRAAKQHLQPQPHQEQDDHDQPPLKLQITAAAALHAA